MSPIVNPEAPTPEPETLTFEIATLAVPEFDTTTSCEWLMPTFTLPKLRLWTFKDSNPMELVLPLLSVVPDCGD